MYQGSSYLHYALAGICVFFFYIYLSHQLLDKKRLIVNNSSLPAFFRIGLFFYMDASPRQPNNKSVSFTNFLFITKTEN